MSTCATVNVSIDVPDLESGLSFYRRVFGFHESSRPFPTMAVLNAGNVTLCLHQKAAGTRPVSAADTRRTYDRHWTPVHLDLHVPALDPVLALIRAEGGLIERELRTEGPKPVAFCSDPFGHGFCVIAETDIQTGRTDREVALEPAAAAPRAGKA
jgi:catechol 2,3-dioxygenase-like lactoylglutathione lyase family enzyme